MTQITYSIRPSTPEDYAFFVDLQWRTMKEYVDAAWNLPDKDFDRHLRMKWAGRHFEILQLDGLDVGVLEVWSEEDTVHLQNIQILPKYQRRGLGTSVVRDILARARQQGFQVELWVFKVNTAWQFYERLGFVIVEETGTHFKMRYE